MGTFEVLSKVSGIPLTEMQKIWIAVKENHKRLDECIGPHDFSDPVNQQIHEAFIRRWRCTKCKGELDSINVSWYKTGLKHG